MKIPLLIFEKIPPLNVDLKDRINQHKNRMSNDYYEPGCISSENENLSTHNRKKNNNIFYPHAVSLRPCCISKTASNNLISFSPQRQDETTIRATGFVPKLSLLADQPVWRQTDEILSSILSITDDTETTL